MKWDNTDLRVGLMVVGGLVLGVVSFLWVGQQFRRNVAPLYTDVGMSRDSAPRAPCSSMDSTWVG